MPPDPQLKSVTIYTDGSCSGNPGRGGYGIVLLHGQHRKELSGGYRLTTNNRMELRAAIIGLEALKEPCKVTLYSDSQYLVETMRCGSAKEWRRNGWRLHPPKTKKAKNPDLWKRLLELCDKHTVTFKWVRGHDNVPENDRCDQVAVAAMQQNDLSVDSTYEAENPFEVQRLPLLERQFTGLHGSKEKITHEGQPCRKCGTQVEKRHPRRRTAKRAYHFEYYFYCPGCRTMYLVEEAKRKEDVPADHDLTGPDEGNRALLDMT